MPQIADEKPPQFLGSLALRGKYCMTAHIYFVAGLFVDQHDAGCLRPSQPVRRASINRTDGNSADSRRGRANHRAFSKRSPCAFRRTVSDYPTDFELAQRR
jgi:hypothetical protein